MYLGFDPIYFMFLAPAMLLAFWAQMKVKTAYASASKIPANRGITGAEAASLILESSGMNNVGIEQAQGFLSDHYDPRRKVLRLSNDVYNGRSLASLGIAAHEAGHAIQDRDGYAPLRIRNGIVPLAGFGGNFSLILFFIGLAVNSFNLVLAGIILYSMVVIFQLVNLPVEFNASTRAKEVLVNRGIVSPDEVRTVDKVLDAAALTYVAATITAIMTLLYFLFKAGLLGGRRRN